jgi:hypothetical protein
MRGGSEGAGQDDETAQVGSEVQSVRTRLAGGDPLSRTRL